MIVLGISPLDKDATVTLMVDGEVTHSVAEERLSRKKMHAGFPHRALDMVLELGGISADDVDHVVYAFFDSQRESELMWRNYADDFRFNRRTKRAKIRTLIREARRRTKRYAFDIPGLSDASEMMQKPWLKRGGRERLSY